MLMNNSFFSNVAKFLGGNFLLTLANLVRDISIAAAFGTAAAADQFFLVAALLIFLVTVAASACRSVYIPVLQQALARSTEEYNFTARRLVAFNVRGTLIVAIALTLAAIAASSIPALAKIPYMMESIQLLIAITPMYMLSAFVEINQGTLQTRDRILLPALMRLGLPLGIVVGVWIGARSLGIHALAIGGLVGSGTAAICIGLLLKKESLLSLTREKLPRDVMLQVRSGILALTLSSSMVCINPVISTWMASFLGAGAVSTLGYANRLTVGIAALLVSSFAPVFLHQFSRHIAARNINSIRFLYSNFFACAPWLGSLMTLGTWVFSGLIAPLLYQRGQFTAADTNVVVTVIDVYALQFPFFLASTPSFTLISALSKNHAFIRLNLILLATNFLAGITLMRFYGIEGLAFSTTVVYAISLLSLNIYLLKEGTIELDSKSLSSALMAFLCMVFAIFAIKYFGLKITLESHLLDYIWAFLLLATVALAGIGINWKRVSAYRHRTG